jgi:hypothetical protein
MTKAKFKHPQDVKADQVKKELDQEKQLVCFRCRKKIPLNHKMIKDVDGNFIGRCLSLSKGGCGRKTTFVEKNYTGIPSDEAEKTESFSERMEKTTEKEIQKDKECKTLATKETYEKGMNQEDENYKNFQDPDLLLNIKKTLDKDHIGDDKAKLFLFACACSCQLIPEYRFSTAITGNSSEGKDNLWNTILRHLPKEKTWFLDLTRTTTASIEDDIKDYNGLYIGEGNFEGGANAPIRDTIKQLVEDGTRVLKKDKRKESKSSRHEIQPRKVGIYSTTKDPNDEELATRYCIISVYGSPSKYARVNTNTKRVAGNIDLQIDRHERKNKSTWITNGLKKLQQFDFIDIPYAPLLEVDCRDARSQRDLKRFLNLIRSVAWLCQHNRVKYSHRGYKILVASAEDLYNAMEIGTEIFDQSLSGMEPRLKKVIESYRKIIKEDPSSINTEIDPAAERLPWVDRSIIQKDLGIKKRETISEHIYRLCDMNIFTTFSKGNRVYVAFKFLEPSDKPSDYPLITVRQNDIYTLIHDNEDKILNELLAGKRTVKRSVASPDKKITSNLLSLGPDRPSDDSKNVDQSHELTIINVLKQKMDGQKRTVDVDDSDSKQKTLDQSHAMQQLNDYARACKNKDGFLEEKAVVAFIKNSLNKKDSDGYYEKLLQKGILTFYPGQGVLFTGDNSGGNKL